MRELSALRDLCTATTEEVFAHYGNALPARGGQLSYTDHGSAILGVCHVDTVVHKPAYRQKKGKAFSTALDDRLGIYILTELLPQEGILLDWLLTDNEECCASTARDFAPPREYNWLIEFDRAGSDVVMYQYDAPMFDELLRPYGLALGSGSYSDIADLDALGVSGFNWGIGYHQQHTSACYVDLAEMRRQVDRFAAFYHEHAATRFECQAVDYEAFNYYRHYGYYWEEEEDAIAYEDEEYGPILWSEVERLEERLYYGTEPHHLTHRDRAILENYLQW